MKKIPSHQIMLAIMALLPASLDASSNDKSNSDGTSSSKTSQTQSSQPTQQKQASAPVKSASAPTTSAPSSNNSQPVVRASSSSSPATTQSSSDKAAQIAAIQSQVQALQKQVTAAQNAGYGANDQIRYDSKGNVAPKATSQSTNTYSSNTAPSSSSVSSSTAQPSSSRSPGVSTSSSPTISYQSAPVSQSTASTSNVKSASSGYTVQKGDTLANIAASHNMTSAQLLALNPQYKSNPNLIGVGQEMTLSTSPTSSPSIPSYYSTASSSGGQSSLSSSHQSSSPNSSSPTISYQSAPVSQSTASTSNSKSASSGYTVKKGDTLANIAASHNMTSAQLLALNPQYQSNPNLIGVGDQMQLTTPKTVGATIPYVSVGTNPTSQTTAQTTTSTKLQSTPYSSSPTFQFTPVSQSTTSSSINTNSGGASYTVKKGDTLANVAASHNMTSAQLLALNPQYKSNPNLIGVGQQLKLSTLNAAAPAIPYVSVGNSASPALSPAVGQSSSFNAPQSTAPAVQQVSIPQFAAPTAGNLYISQAPTLSMDEQYKQAMLNKGIARYTDDAKAFTLWLPTLIPWAGPVIKMTEQQNAYDQKDWPVIDNVVNSAIKTEKGRQYFIALGEGNGLGSILAFPFESYEKVDNALSNSGASPVIDAVNIGLEAK